tara:strand:+ start:273 stop:833 length:561 start_codon:yes stop_codon:yes gene_type:complete
MRIISGTLKGRSIDFLKNSNTRPLKDSVRESIFNILYHSKTFKVNLKNSNVLDLYSGIGSFGIECISRGAVRVMFVEQDINAVKILRENLTKLSLINASKIINSSIENVLNKKIEEKFDIIFLDPPFKDFKFKENIQLIKERKIFKPNHILVIHREKKTNDNFKGLLEIISTKNYGRSKILFGVIV